MTDRERNYEEECGDYGGTNRNGDPCGLSAGWGTPNDSGRCKNCLGTSPDGSSHEGNDWAEGNGGGAPEENTNAVSHGAFSDKKNLYDQEFSAREQDLADQIFADYAHRYRDVHGLMDDEGLPAGFELRLFNVAVNAVTEMRVENWYTDKPDDLNTDTPHLDRETHISESGQKFYRYKKSPALAAIKHLSNYNHKWLKALRILPDADSQQADATDNLASAIKRISSGDD